MRPRRKYGAARIHSISTTFLTTRFGIGLYGNYDVKVFHYLYVEQKGPISNVIVHNTDRDISMLPAIFSDALDHAMFEIKMYQTTKAREGLSNGAA